MVGMGADHVVGHALGHPNCTLLILTLTDEFHNPHLVLVGNGETLTATLVAILLTKFVYQLNGLARSLTTLKGNPHKRTVVHHARTTIQLGTTTEGCLHDAELVLVQETCYLICLIGLGYLTKIITCLVVIDGTHSTLGMLHPGLVVQGREHAITVTTVTYNNTTIGRSLLANDKVGTWHGSNSHQEKA